MLKQWHWMQLESGGAQNAGAKHRPKYFDVPSTFLWCLSTRDGTIENSVGTAERGNASDRSSSLAISLSLSASAFITLTLTMQLAFPDHPLHTGVPVYINMQWVIWQTDRVM